jgi:hypothetical protein
MNPEGSMVLAALRNQCKQSVRLLGPYSPLRKVLQDKKAVRAAISVVPLQPV